MAFSALESSLRFRMGLNSASLRSFGLLIVHSFDRASGLESWVTDWLVAFSALGSSMRFRMVYSIGRVTFLLSEKKSNQKKAEPTMRPLRGSLRYSRFAGFADGLS